MKSVAVEIPIPKETSDFIKESSLEFKTQLLKTAVNYLESIKSNQSINTLVPIFMISTGIYLFEMVEALYKMKDLSLPKSKTEFIRDIAEVSMVMINEDLLKDV